MKYQRVEANLFLAAIAGFLGSAPLVHAADQNTRLKQAAESGRIDEVKSLLNDGVSPNARISGNSTALMWASWGGHIAVVRLLIEKGADVNASDDVCATALMLASANGLQIP